MSENALSDISFQGCADVRAVVSIDGSLNKSSVNCYNSVKLFEPLLL